MRKRFPIPCLTFLPLTLLACGERAIEVFSPPVSDGGSTFADAAAADASGTGEARAYVPAHLDERHEKLAIVHSGAAGSPEERLAFDLSGYIARMSGVVPSVVDSETDADHGAVLVSLLAKADGVPGAYAIEAEGSAAARRYRIEGTGVQGLAYGVYQFLETLGARFFHPRHEFVPRYDGLYLPSSLSISAAPALENRTWHVHTLHPLEYQPFLMDPAPDHLPGAREMIDWLVKTRQNRLSLYAMDNVDMDRWIPYMTELLDYAHTWGVRIIPTVIMWSGSSLQHAYVLVDNADRWKEQMEERIDALLEAPFDGIEIAFGEFLASDAERTLEWLNHFTAYANEKRPGIDTGAVVHVGKYDSTTIEYNGEKMLYYFLPKFADPRLTVFVHTVMFYNIYDRAWGAYGHERFDEHRAFLLSQIGKRGVEYYPESAYWCTFDIDIPLFLPVYVESRVSEIESVMDDAAAAGGTLSGAMIFSSGHEWGYWLTDYSYARALYDGKHGTAAHIAHAAQAFGPAAAEFEAWLSALISRQREWFLDKNLIPYLTGEDIADDLGWAAGIDTHPKRLQFREMAAMDEAPLVALRDGDLAAVSEMAAWFEASASEIEALRARVVAEAAPWFSEFAIGARMLGVRARHQEALYGAVTSALLGDKKAGRIALERASEIQNEARALVLSMEALYRYGPQLTASHYTNNTIYPFGYLGQTHELCFWKRQFMQAKGVVLFGAEPDIGELPSCAN